MTDQTAAVQGKHRSTGGALAPKLTALLPADHRHDEGQPGTCRWRHYNSQKALLDQMESMNDTAIAMGQSFDTPRTATCSTCRPRRSTTGLQDRPEAVPVPDGSRPGSSSPTRAIRPPRGGIARWTPNEKAAQDALKMSSLSNAKVYLGGTAATYKDMRRRPLRPDDRRGGRR